MNILMEVSPEVIRIFQQIHEKRMCCTGLHRYKLLQRELIEQRCLEPASVPPEHDAVRH